MIRIYSIPDTQHSRSTDWPPAFSMTRPMGGPWPTRPTLYWNIQIIVIIVTAVTILVDFRIVRQIEALQSATNSELPGVKVMRWLIRSPLRFRSQYDWVDVVTETQSSHLISNRTLAQMPSGPCPPITARHQHPQPAVRYLTRASIRIRDVIDRGGPGDAQASTSVTTGERTAAPVQSVSVRQQRASHEYRQDTYGNLVGHVHGEAGYPASERARLFTALVGSAPNTKELPSHPMNIGNPIWCQACGPLTEMSGSRILHCTLLANSSVAVKNQLCTISSRRRRCKESHIRVSHLMALQTQTRDMGHAQGLR